MKFSLTASVALALLIYCCGACNTKEARRLADYDGKTLTIDEAVKQGFATMVGNGQGTFTKIGVIIQNNLAQQLNLEVRGGLYFKNPKSAEQSLLTVEEIGKIQIAANDKYQQIIPTVCTDVQLEIPGKERNWSSAENKDGTIDEILTFYSKYKSQITGYLERKNPEKFQTPTDQHQFLQVLVWAYSGGSYNQILQMLSKDVYGNDIERAKRWLDGVYEEAAAMAQFIKEGDFKGLADYLALDEKIEKAQKGIKNAYEDGKNRLKNILSE